MPLTLRDPTGRPSAARLAHISGIIARLSGLDPSISPRVAAVTKLLDSETVSSIPSIIESFEKRREAILANKNLSDIGKAEEIQGFANSILGNIATRAKQISDLEAEHANDRATAVPIPKADAAETLIDLALAQHLRATDPIPSALVQMSERVRLAAARVPIELTGLTPAAQAKAHGSLMSPAKAVQLSAEAEALDAARTVTQQAIAELAPQAKWPATELVRHFGDRWRLPGIHPDSAKRLAEGGDDGAKE